MSTVNKRERTGAGLANDTSVRQQSVSGLIVGARLAYLDAARLA